MFIVVLNVYIYLFYTLLQNQQIGKSSFKYRISKIHYIILFQIYTFMKTALSFKVLSILLFCVFVTVCQQSQTVIEQNLVKENSWKQEITPQQWQEYLQQLREFYLAGQQKKKKEKQQQKQIKQTTSDQNVKNVQNNSKQQQKKLEPEKSIKNLYEKQKQRSERKQKLLKLIKILEQLQMLEQLQKKSYTTDQKQQKLSTKTKQLQKQQQINQSYQQCQQILPDLDNPNNPSSSIKIKLYSDRLIIERKDVKQQAIYKGIYYQSSKQINRRIILDDIFRKMCKQIFYQNSLSVSAYRPKDNQMIKLGEKGVVKVPIKIIVQGVQYNPISEFKLQKISQLSKQENNQNTNKNHQKVIIQTPKKQQSVSQKQEGKNSQTNIIKNHRNVQQIHSEETIKNILQMKQKIIHRKNFGNNIDQQEIHTKMSRNSRGNNFQRKSEQIVKNVNNKNNNNKSQRFQKFKSFCISMLCLAALYIILKPKKVKPLPPAVLNKLDRKNTNLKLFQYSNNSIMKRTTGDWSKVVTNISVKNNNKFKVMIKNIQNWGINVGITQVSTDNNHPLNEKKVLNKIIYGSNSIFYENQAIKPRQGQGFNLQELLTVIVDIQKNTIIWEVNGKIRYLYQSQINLKDKQWRFCIEMRGAGDQVQFIQ